MHSQVTQILKKLPRAALSLYCIILAVVCQAFWPFSSVFAANYGVNSFYFKDFTADYYLSQADDGTSRLRVVEQFTAVFPSSDQNHGIERVIPYTNQDGQNLTMASDDYLEINLWRNDVEELPYKVEGGDGYYRVYIGDPDTYVHGEQIYTLEYEFRNVITAFTDDQRSWQELYWDTNGNDWSQRFGLVTARVHFDSQELADAFTGSVGCYVGRYGANGADRCNVSKLDDGIEFQAKNLLSGENLTFVIEFQSDTFALPKKRYDYRMVIAFIICLAVAIATLVAALMAARRLAKKRRFYKDYFIKPEYTPPHPYTVAEMGHNYIGKSGGSLQVATLMELAVNHKIELIKQDAKVKSKKWQIKVLSLDLTTEQVTVLRILNGGDHSLSVGQIIPIKIHRATSTLIQLNQKFSQAIDADLARQGLWEFDPNKSKKDRPQSAKTSSLLTPMLGAVSVWFVVGLLATGFLLTDVPSYVELAGGVPLTVITGILFCGTFFGSIFAYSKLHHYEVMTEKGLEYSRYLDGLKLYIKMAEADRLQFLQSVDGADVSHQGIVKLYEKLLPYAVFFRLEKSWLKEMERYYSFDDVAAPIWYVGVGAFSAQDFAASLSSANSLITSSTAHSTSNNSSSGFSGMGGGGFSGGGGGGGGGGGW